MSLINLKSDFLKIKSIFQNLKKMAQFVVKKPICLKKINQIGQNLKKLQTGKNSSKTRYRPL
jgi:hypothetical protein